MKNIKIEGSSLDMVVDSMGKSELLSSLKKNALTQCANRAELYQYDANEIVFRENDPSDSFFIIIRGEAGIMHDHQSSEGMMELGRIKPVSVMGEIGLLLNEPRSATICALEETMMLKLDKNLFDYMFKNIPDFGPAISRNLGKRVRQLSTQIQLPEYGKNEPPPTPEVIHMLPIDFIIRHRVLPLQMEGNVLCIGFVNDPTSIVINSVRRFTASMELKMVHIDHSYFDEVMRDQAGVKGWDEPSEEPEIDETTAYHVSSPRLDPLLKRMVGEGASDLHLSAGHVPRWRIDGEIMNIKGTKKLEQNDALELLEPVMDELSKKDFSDNNDADFGYTLPGSGRFRVNLFRDYRGVGAVFRLIPSKILTFEQLNLPPAIKSFCELSKGLIAVTGPTGSGKSTTLAAMVNYINKTRPVHIITMEDPIEFIHNSDKALVNQREMRRHSNSYSASMKAALREDPDIVLIGELRDYDTISLAVELANTGHLVFGTLHTNTAISTVSRIVDSFPSEQQNQIRAGLGDSLKGVVAQNLCKVIGGGRIAALEVLVVNRAVANLIREAKPQQILSTMQTGKAAGNCLLNDDLERLVREKKIDREEAIDKAVDKDDLITQLDALRVPAMKSK